MSVVVGQKIELNDGRYAKVRFIGTTSFQTGDWIGVELEDASGKNDGAVKGERYFTCEPGHGMFLRQAGVRRIVEEPKPKDRPISNGHAVKARPSSMHVAASTLKRNSVVADHRRTSTLTQSPTPGARAGTGIRSPTKQLGSNGVSNMSMARSITPATGKKVPSVPPAKQRQSMAPPTSTVPSRRISTLTSAPVGRVARPSISKPTITSRVPPGRSSGSGSALPGQTSARGSRETEISEVDSFRSSRESQGTTATSSGDTDNQDTDDQRDEDDQTAKVSFAPRPPPVPEDPVLPQSRSRRPSSPTAASVQSQRTIRSTAASNRQIEELEAKVRLLERKRIEDRDIKKSMEQAQQERDQYKTIIEKLQAKYRPQLQEIIDLKKSLEEAEQRAETIMALQAEHDSVMELATIDREMAEEKAQGLEEQLGVLRSKSEELELELEILREENEELSKEMSPEERTSAGWMQMEKSNERLREALLRLRDITQDKEQELLENISSLEADLKEMETLKSTHDHTREKLLQSETDVGDLRQQLEAAQESEEMIEQLSEQKVNLEDRIHQLRNTIEELEELRELNDELVINHQEEEKQMQEEIDFRDSLLADRERTGKQQQEALDQADYTISRYRNLVSELQASLQDLEASKQISESEATELNNKSRAMQELNMKLQSSAAKTQVKTIDLELKRLDAQEASEHLAIVQLFLPDAFSSERDSVLALLRLKRISFKAGLMQNIIRERIASFGSRQQDEDVFSACHIVDELDWIACMANRFVNSISGCHPSDFSQFHQVLYEAEPVEKALNGYIDGLRNDTFDETISAQELERSIAVLNHLASIHIKEDLASHADNLLMRSQWFQTQLESAASALGLMRTLIETNTASSKTVENDSEKDDDDDDDDEVTSDLQLTINRAETLNGLLRSAKVTAGKIYRSLNDLEARSLTLEHSWSASLDSVQANVAKIASYARRAGSALQQLFNEEGRSEPFTPSEIARTIAPAATESFELTSPESGPFNAIATQVRELSELLNDVVAIATDLDNTVEFERAPAPWVARAEELHQSKITSVDIEAQLTRALESVAERNVMLKGKETELEEQSVRIEMLEARMKDAGKRSAKIAELEKHLHETRENEKKTRTELLRARQDATRELERVKAEMSRLAAERPVGRNPNEDSIDADAMGSATRINMKHQEHKVSSLESAVRYLKEENRRLRLPTITAPLHDRVSTEWLNESLTGLAPHAEQRQRRADAARKQGRAALDRLLDLATSKISSTPDLTALPANKLAWRPARGTARWRVERQKEDWEGWKSERKAAIQQARVVLTKSPRQIVLTSSLVTYSPAESKSAGQVNGDHNVEIVE